MTDEILRRYEAGDPVDEIAADAGVSPRTVRRRAARAGLSRRHGPRARHDADIWALLDAGRTPTAAAEAVGVSRSTVYAAIRRRQACE